MNYGKKIAELRKIADLTQAELGEQLNVTSQAVSKWEKGVSEPDLETINKLCSLFNISPNEFFKSGEKTSEQEVTVADANSELTEKIEEIVETDKPKAPTIIYGYCERCSKPVGPNEYKIDITTSHHTTRHGPRHHTSSTSTQHIYCNDCYDKLLKEREEEKQQRAYNNSVFESEKMNKNFRRSFFWATLAALCMIIVGYVICFEENYGTGLQIAIYALSMYTGFALVSQAFWGEGVAEILLFFTRSLHLPGLIFTLDLDGIIWLITVKLIGAILSFLFSAICMFIGLCVAGVFSFFTFPFALANKIKEKKAVKQKIANYEKKKII